MINRSLLTTVRRPNIRIPRPFCLKADFHRSYRQRFHPRVRRHFLPSEFLIVTFLAREPNARLWGGLVAAKRRKGRPSPAGATTADCYIYFSSLEVLGIMADAPELPLDAGVTCCVELACGCIPAAP